MSHLDRYYEELESLPLGQSLIWDAWHTAEGAIHRVQRQEDPNGVWWSIDTEDENGNCLSEWQFDNPDEVLDHVWNN